MWNMHFWPSAWQIFYTDIVCGVRDKYQVYVYMMMIIQLASAISLDVRQMVLYHYATGGKQM